MFLGIEIGGTKLQLAVVDEPGSPFLELERFDVNAANGAYGILEQIEKSAPALVRRYEVARIGIGFGGPVDHKSGTAKTSHQIDGWDDFPLRKWGEDNFGVPIVIGNDCDAAALAEAKFGAGQGRSRVFFVTVGTGVGGGFVVDSQLPGLERPAISEIGHLRPGLHAEEPTTTVESIASGWGIAAEARSRMTGDITASLERLRNNNEFVNLATIRQQIEIDEDIIEEHIADLLNRCDQQVEELTAKTIAQAAADGNDIARDILHHAARTLGWAIAQVITLLAPEAIVIGGGVSQIGEQMFFAPIRAAVASYVFPPLADSYEIIPAALGEEVVLHGAIALAADTRL